MTTLVCKPEKVPIVKGRGVYGVYMNGDPLGLFIRAKNAGDADEQLRIVFRHQLASKYLDFRKEDFGEYQDGKWKYYTDDPAGQRQDPDKGKEDLPGLHIERGDT